MDYLSLELWKATISGDYNLAHRLISNGAYVNQAINAAFGVNMVPLLHCAVAKGNIELIHLLINHGANIHVRDNNYRTVLHVAVLSGDRPDVIEMLINKGAVVDSRDINGTTPLFWAVQKNFNESAQKLIARGAPLDPLSYSANISLLHVAVTCNNISMAKVLISHGVNIETKDINGSTPLLCAFILEQCNMEMVSI